MRFSLLVAPVLLLPACTADTRAPPASAAFVQAATPEEAGRYLFLVGGCNDCHTTGWAESNGTLPETAWALGNPVGFRGPWGTTYPENLRRSAQEHTEARWVRMFRRGEGLPPMPWMNYRAMPEADLVALQRFLRRLGPGGKPAPDTLPPGREPTTPYVDLTPRTPAAGGR